MKRRNQLAFFLTIISFFVLYPGITLPMLTMTLYGEVDASVTNIGMNILNKSSSITQTIQELYQSGNILVAFLILFFSIMVPFLKGLLVLSCITMKNIVRKKKIFDFIKSIGKWSQADVFVVAVFIAYLSTRIQASRSSHDAYVMGMNLKINVNTMLDSKLGPGFYFFLSYCFISLIALQLFDFKEET